MSLYFIPDERNRSVRAPAFVYNMMSNCGFMEVLKRPFKVILTNTICLLITQLIHRSLAKYPKRKLRKKEDFILNLCNNGDYFFKQLK